MCPHVHMCLTVLPVQAIKPEGFRSELSEGYCIHMGESGPALQCKLACVSTHLDTSQSCLVVDHADDISVSRLSRMCLFD